MKENLGWNSLYLSEKQTWNFFNTEFQPQWKDRKSSYQVKQVFRLFWHLTSVVLE